MAIGLLDYWTAWMDVVAVALNIFQVLYFEGVINLESEFSSAQVSCAWGK